MVNELIDGADKPCALCYFVSMMLPLLSVVAFAAVAIMVVMQLLVALL